MSGTSLLTWLAIRVLPRPQRDRFAEEWEADARDAASAGVSALSLGIGLLRAALIVRGSSAAGRAASLRDWWGRRPSAPLVLEGLAVGALLALTDVPAWFLLVALAARTITSTFLDHLRARRRRIPSRTDTAAGS